MQSNETGRAKVEKPHAHFDRCRDMMQYFTILLVLQTFLSGVVWDCTTV